MEKSTTEKTEWPTVAEREAFWKAKENDGPYDGYWRPQDDPHIPDERRLSLEDGKAPSDSTLAEQEELSRVEATCDYIDHWAEPEWTLRDEVGESYKEIP